MNDHPPFVSFLLDLRQAVGISAVALMGNESIGVVRNMLEQRQLTTTPGTRLPIGW